MSFTLARGDGHEGRTRATVRIGVARGTAERARLAVTGPVRWAAFPPSCTAKGERLACELGDLAGTTELRLAFRERAEGRGSGGTDRTLRAVITAPDLPETVKTVRLPGRDSRDGFREETGERYDRPKGAAPGPVKTRTRGAEPARPGESGPVRSETRGSAPVQNRTGDTASVRTRPGDAPVRRRAGDAASAPAKTRKPTSPKARRSEATQTTPRRADGTVKQPRPAAPANPAAPAAPALPASPAVPAVPAVPATPALPGGRPSPSAQAPAVLPAPPKEPVVALPPVRPTTSAAQEPRLSIISSEGPLADDGRGWSAVLGAALAGEMVLLWSLTAVTLWRRRV